MYGKYTCKRCYALVKASFEFNGKFMEHVLKHFESSDHLLRIGFLTHFQAAR